VAVTGYALLLWIDRQPVEMGDISAMSAQVELNTMTMQQQLSESLTERVGSDQQDRLDSPLGQALFRTCAEWTDFYESVPSEASGVHRDAACAEFEDYVKEGIEPARDDTGPPDA
jgi:hypothetical protein